MRQGSRRYALPALVAVGTLLASTCVGTVAATAATDGSVVASGDDWSVTRSAGGYDVSITLDAPLPVVDDAPTLVVDGTTIGTATESADGLTLTATTTDSAVADATSVEQEWASSDGDKADDTAAENEANPLLETSQSDLTASEKAQSAQALAALDDSDPSEHGTYAWDEATYDFGDQAIALAGIGGVRGEMTGKVWLPTTGGKRPVVLLLHGRHSSCYSGTSSASGWPCALTGRTSIPSYLGYEDTADTLASQGYMVISISANAINANDNQLAADYGAKARGQLVLDSLEMLREANAGETVSFHDAYLDTTKTLDQALTGDVTAADLVGRLDLDDVGIMGHSRGGEGVTSAAELNEGLTHPFGIKSVLALAPVDFGRATVGDVDFLTILPYCDGDVSNQQGQHIYDDSRHAFDDNVLRSTVWVMGANHNFFNTVWTPGKFQAGGADDWGATSTDSVCGPQSSTNIRLSSDDEYDVGTGYMSAWFRLTLGGDDEFLPLFTDDNPTLPSVPAADIRAITQTPGSARADINTFTDFDGAVTVAGTASAAICENWTGRTTPQPYAYCSTTRTGSGAVPHWAPMRFGSDVPASPMLKTTWTSATGQVRVAVPASARDASGYDELTVNMAPDESVTTSTDTTITVLDGSGHTYSTLASAINPNAVKRMPASTSTTLNKIVLQQVAIPTAAVAAAGVDLTDVREVRFVATAAGGLYLSDLALQRDVLGTPGSLGTIPTLSTLHANVEEGNGVVATQLAVVLDRPTDKVVTGYTTLYSVAGGNSTNALAKVTFQPGETCQVVTFNRYADSVAGSSASTTWWSSTTNVTNAVKGTDGFGTLTVREDDGTPTTTPFGAQGDACAEYEALSAPGTVTASTTDLVPGGTVDLSATGYRVGEGVALTLGDLDLGTVVADSTGTVALTATVPDEFPLGATTISAVGAGSGFTSTVGAEVLEETSVALSASTTSTVYGSAVDLTATVPAGVAGQVAFFDGTASLGVADVVGTTATLTVSTLGVGAHGLTATYLGSDVYRTTTSAPVAVTVAKLTSGVTLGASASSLPAGKKVTLTATVPVGVTGAVEFFDGTRSLGKATISGRTASTAVALAVGTHTVKVVYLGNATTEAATSASFTVKVVKASTSKVKVSGKKFKRGKKATVTVKVATLSNGQVATGKVAVYVGKKKVRTVTLSAAKKGKVKVAIAKKYTKAKKIKVKAVFTPKDTKNVTAKTSKAVAIKAKK